MKGREKIEAAFAPEGTPEIGVVLCYTGIFVRDHWAQLTEAPWWDIHSPDLERQLAWRRDVIGKVGQDWMDVPSCDPRDERPHLAIEVRGDGVYRVDRRTGSATRLKPPVVSGDHIPEPTLPMPESEEEVDAHIPLAPAFDAEAFAQSGAGDLAAALQAEYGQSVCPVGGASSPVNVLYDTWGFANMMAMIATRPDLARRACERYLTWALRDVAEAAAIGAAAIFFDEAMTDVISPEAYASVSLPYVQRVVEAIRGLGMVSIYCFLGNPAGKWEQILASGADALALEESKKGWTIDIQEVAERLDGRCTLLGNLDAMHLLPHGSEAELRAEIARQIAAGRHNHSRFIMCIGSPVTPETPVERVRLFCDLAHELGA